MMATTIQRRGLRRAGLEPGRCRSALLAAALLAFATGATRRASALCAASEPDVYWSFPADGATDVPTNARLLATHAPELVPTLNGEPLARLDDGGYELGPLAPFTTYHVVWQVLPFAKGSPGPREISFTTGAGMLVDRAPTTPSSVTVTRDSSRVQGCPLAESQGCFDTVPPTSVRFEAGPADVAWLVDRVDCTGRVSTIIWPAACGAPVLSSENPIVCARLRNSNGIEYGAATDTICSTPNIALSSEPSSGCTGAWPPVEATTLAADNGVECTSTPASCAPPESGCSLTPQSLRGTGPARWAGALGAAALCLMRSARRARRRSEL